MAVWGVPTAHEDDAERAVRAGLELVDAVAALGDDVGVPDLAMRVGIVTGEVAVTVGADAAGHGRRRRGEHRLAGAVRRRARAGVGRRDDPAADLVGDHLRRRRAATRSRARSTRSRCGRCGPWSPRCGGAQRADGLEAPLVGRDRELRLVKELFHARRGGRPSGCCWSSTASRASARPGSAWEFEKYVDGLSARPCGGTAAAAWPTARASRSTRWPRRCAAGCARIVDGAASRTRDRAGRCSTAGWPAASPTRPSGRGCGPGSARCSASAPVGGFAREDLFSAWTTFLERVGDGRTRWCWSSTTRSTPTRGCCSSSSTCSRPPTSPASWCC